MKARFTFVLFLLATFVATGGSVAHASCLAPPPIEEAYAAAETVFVGTVIDLDATQRHAIVEVIEVWKGPDLPVEVDVSGGPRDANQFTSVDRTFAPGETYVFFLNSQAPPFSDDSCTSTQPMNDNVGALQPDDARAPLGGTPSTTAAGADDETADSESGLALAALLIGGGVLGAAIAAVSVVAFRRRRTTDTAAWDPQHRISNEADDTR